ncbi:hypothetical protein BV898_06767 [Hypsibius exemplaris]|uniref:SAM domain-containing protein n=1 Tax=Hypsibius exemplaris TaxID=2072580 RepID=A0A1W0WV93_HYPEX|nr:hypothetical protein BV898_06767 [Hypsibius exemplaris]
MPKAVKAAMIATYKAAVERAIRTLNPLCWPGKAQISEYCQLHCGLQDADLLSHYIDLFVATGELLEERGNSNNCTRYRLLAAQEEGDGPVSAGASTFADNNDAAEPVSVASSEVSGSGATGSLFTGSSNGVSSVKTTKRLLCAVRAACSATCRDAVSLQQIQRQLSSSHRFTRLKGLSLEGRLRQEVTNRRLRMVGLCYGLGPATDAPLVPVGDDDPTDGTERKPAIPPLVIKKARIAEAVTADGCADDDDDGKPQRKKRKRSPQRLDCKLLDRLASRNITVSMSVGGEYVTKFEGLKTAANGEIVECTAAAAQEEDTTVRKSGRVIKRPAKFSCTKAERKRMRKNGDAQPKETPQKAQAFEFVIVRQKSPSLAAGSVIPKMAQADTVAGTTTVPDKVPLPVQQVTVVDSPSPAKIDGDMEIISPVSLVTQDDSVLDCSKTCPSPEEASHMLPQSNGLLGKAVVVPLDFGDSEIPGDKVEVMSVQESVPAEINDAIPLSPLAATEDNRKVAVVEVETQTTDTSDVPSASESIGSFLKKCPVFAGYPRAITAGVEQSTKVTIADLVSFTLDRWQEAQRPNQHAAGHIQAVSGWTCEMIADKLRRRGHELYADTVMKHKLDGSALLLLLRDDVITRLELPLVHGLKMWRELCDLASRN